MKVDREWDEYLYSASQTRNLDKIAIETHGIPGYELMTRAGAAAFEELLRRWPGERRICVVCGTGNNGGDGYVLARFALQAGLRVRASSIGDLHRIGGDARKALDDFLGLGGEVRLFDPKDLVGADVLVDAIFGTGLDREVSGPAARAINAINAGGMGVLALDIPSGLNGDTGVPFGPAIRADCTVTFVGRKIGLFTAYGPEYCGDVVFSALSLPADVYRDQPNVGSLMPAFAPLAPRRGSAHKGDSGHLLIVGGNLGFAGAARLAGEAALRAGAGLVTVATRSENVSGIVAGRPELMVAAVHGAADLERLLARADVVAAGPGLGLDEWAKGLHRCIVSCKVPQVLDADAITLLSRSVPDGVPRILTPHPGEAAGVLGIKPAEIQRDRVHAARRIQSRFPGTVVLKGSGTIVLGSSGRLSVCPFGNPGLAVGGSGDVLTGIVAALVAQGLTLDEAAARGVCLHAQAADRAALSGQRGMLPSDLLPHIRRLANSNTGQ